MRFYSETLSFDSKEPIEVMNITESVSNAVAKSGIKKGLAFVMTPHTTASICINEPCPRLKEDVVKFLSGIVDKDIKHRHDIETIDGRPNAKSHLIAHLLPKSETIPVENGKIQFGTWQALFFIELDGSRDGRKVEVRVMGD